MRKPGATAEDQTRILSSVYDPDRDFSDIIILDAQDFASDSVATIRLLVRIQFTFHGGMSTRLGIRRLAGLEISKSA